MHHFSYQQFLIHIFCLCKCILVCTHVGVGKCVGGCGYVRAHVGGCEYVRVCGV